MTSPKDNRSPSVAFGNENGKNSSKFMRKMASAIKLGRRSNKEDDPARQPACRGDSDDPTNRTRLSPENEVLESVTGINRAQHDRHGLFRVDTGTPMMWNKLKADSKDAFKDGLTFMKNHEYDEARQFFQKALRSRLMMLGANHPEVAAVHEVLGHIAARQDDMESAHKHYDAVLRALSSNQSPEKNTSADTDSCRRPALSKLDGKRDLGSMCAAR